MPWRHIHGDRGENIPVSASEFSGLGFMGGAMRVNDPLPWTPDALRLIRQAVAETPCHRPTPAI